MLNYPEQPHRSSPLASSITTHLGAPLALIDTTTSAEGILSPAGSTKIRFAPLPATRPRSYSTGHNLFLEDGDITEGTERAWVRRDSHQAGQASSGAEFAVSLSDDEEDEEPSRGRRPTQRAKREPAEEENIFSKDRWRMEGQKVGKTSTPPTLGRHQSNKSEESITSKILRPLSFGLVKKKNRESSRAGSARTASDDGNSHVRGESLSRVSSIESDVSRGSSVSGISAFSGASSRRTAEGRTWGSEAGGIRRTAANSNPHRRWEQQQLASKSSSSAMVSSHQYAPSRRANYPPVAQRSKKKPKPDAATKVSDPKFVEWGFKTAGGSGGGMGNNRKVNPDEDEEEDGSGLAWIKRRKEERRLKAEEDERIKIEEEVREAERSLLGAAGITPSINLIPDSPSREEYPAFPEPLEHDLHPDPLPDDGDGLVPIKSVDSMDSLSSQLGSNEEPSIPSTPSDSLDDLHISTATLRSHAKASPLALPHNRADYRRSKSPLGTKDLRRESEDSEDDEEDEDEDSDLDEEELAVEEALREQARITAISAGMFPAPSCALADPSRCGEVFCTRLDGPQGRRCERYLSRRCTPVSRGTVYINRQPCFL